MGTKRRSDRNPKITPAVARAMAAAAAETFGRAWSEFSPLTLASLFDEHTAIAVYEAMHETRLRLGRVRAHIRATKSGGLSNRRTH